MIVVTVTCTVAGCSWSVGATVSGTTVAGRHSLVVGAQVQVGVGSTEDVGAVHSKTTAEVGINPQGGHLVTAMATGVEVTFPAAGLVGIAGLLGNWRQQQGETRSGIVGQFGIGLPFAQDWRQPPGRETHSFKLLTLRLGVGPWDVEGQKQRFYSVELGLQKVWRAVPQIDFPGTGSF